MFLVRAAESSPDHSMLSDVCCSIRSNGARPICCPVVGVLEMRTTWILAGVALPVFGMAVLLVYLMLAAQVAGSSANDVKENRG